VVTKYDDRLLLTEKKTAELRFCSLLMSVPCTGQPSTCRYEPTKNFPGTDNNNWGQTNDRPSSLGRQPGCTVAHIESATCSCSPSAELGALPTICLFSGYSPSHIGLIGADRKRHAALRQGTMVIRKRQNHTPVCGTSCPNFRIIS
jgi:hypothetical protein